jgi:hypothetical protein
MKERKEWGREVGRKEGRKTKKYKGGLVQCLTSAILATQKAEIRRILVPGQPGKKLARLHLNNSWAWWHASAYLGCKKHK